MVSVEVLVGLAALVITGVDWLSQHIRNKFVLSEGEYRAALQQTLDETMTAREQEMIQATSACINDYFGGPLLESMQNMSCEERIEASNAIINRLCALYGLTLDGVIYKELDGNYMGAYNWKQNTITLNLRFLMCNEPEAIREYFDTIIHELKHGVQWHVVHGKLDWEIDEAIQRAWWENFTNYISVNRSKKMYFLQVVELNASAFAMGCMEGVNL